MAITVHFEVEGSPIVLPLDVVEVAFSHTGEALAKAFQDVLDSFGISHKVNTL